MGLHLYNLCYLYGFGQEKPVYLVKQRYCTQLETEIVGEENSKA